jgi:hypothetical protein
MRAAMWILLAVVAGEAIGFGALVLIELRRREDPMDVPPDLADMHELTGGRLPELTAREDLRRV